jgi:hypothetical protein
MLNLDVLPAPNLIVASEGMDILDSAPKYPKERAI